VASFAQVQQQQHQQQQQQQSDEQAGLTATTSSRRSTSSEPRVWELGGRRELPPRLRTQHCSGGSMVVTTAFHHPRRKHKSELQLRVKVVCHMGFLKL